MVHSNIGIVTMNKFLSSTCLILLATTAQVSAQSMIDAELSFAYINAPDDSFDYQLQGGGSAEFSAGPISFQTDVLFYKYEGVNDWARSYGLHAFYEVAPGLDVGLAYADDDYDYGIAYLEAKYVSGSNAFEGYYGVVVDNEDDTYFGIEYTRSLGAIGSMTDVDVIVGYAVNYYEGSPSVTNPYVGTSIGLGSGFSVDARYASMDSGDYRYVTLGVTKTFGAGTTFGQRGFAGTFPGY